VQATRLPFHCRNLLFSKEFFEILETGTEPALAG
jgi:hypothetical protein